MRLLASDASSPNANAIDGDEETAPFSMSVELQMACQPFGKPGGKCCARIFLYFDDWKST